MQRAHACEKNNVTDVVQKLGAGHYDYDPGKGRVRMTSTTTVNVNRLRYRILNGLLDAASQFVHGNKASARLERTIFLVDDISPHEGLHRLPDPRYKEWWYFDSHLEDGRVISTAIVFSIVRTHYFVWVYDPSVGKISEEVIHDGDVIVNAWGGRGVSLQGERITIEGSHETGYRLEFNGINLQGKLVFSDPIPGRAEHHRGVSATHYGLYQVPRLKVSGELTTAAKDSGLATKANLVQGVGYHDHWWCISHRITRWNWLQVKFPQNMVIGFYDGCYGYRGEDVHRYGWVFTPQTGYTYFDTRTLAFTSEEAGWKLEVSGPECSLHLDARPRAERYEFKPVVKVGLLLGEVQYFQYPINTTGQLRLKDQTFRLESKTGILEWDWLAVW